MKSILLIEASPEKTRLPELILSRATYRIRLARTEREALETAAAEPPDLIMAGAVEAGPEGGDLIGALRAMPALAGTPLLALLEEGADPAPGGEEGLEAAGEERAAAGPDEIVRLPANPFELLAKVRFLLDEEGRRPPPRLALRREAALEAGEIHATGSLLNLSGSGALLETEVAGVLEGPIRLRFSLPRRDRVIESVGRVVRRSTPEEGVGRIAVEFVELDPESRRVLESFLFLTG
jgi:DNA-binding response OmpR family regulator